MTPGNWYDDRRNLLALFLFLMERGDTQSWDEDQQARFLEEPWHHQSDFDDMVAVHQEHTETAA